MTIQGILPALVTPYDADGEVDTSTAAMLVRTLNERGTDGYFVAGTNGEYYLLSAGERERLLETVAGAAGDRTVIAQVAATDHRDVLRLTRGAADLGADAVCANIPLYFDYTDASLMAYFRELREHTDLPLLAYYIPGFTGRRIDPEILLELAREGTLQGMKYTSTDMGPLSRLLTGRPDGFSVLVGADDVLLGALALGADGGIGGSYNLISPLYAQMLTDIRADRLAHATSLQDTAAEFLHLMDGWESISFIKSALRGRGVDVGQARAPMSPIDAATDARVTAQLDGLEDLAPYLLPRR
jgi:N-acetylneuraminate lyase